jgi:hypothetical protein
VNFKVVETGGDIYGIQREQWDDGNNVVALEPAWWSATTATPDQHRAAQGRRRGHHHRRQRTRPRPRRRPLHDLPDPARPAY